MDSQRGYCDMFEILNSLGVDSGVLWLTIHQYVSTSYQDSTFSKFQQFISL